jgi:hypothetical protein
MPLFRAWLPLPLPAPRAPRLHKIQVATWPTKRMQVQLDEEHTARRAPSFENGPG